MAPSPSSSSSSKKRHKPVTYNRVSHHHHHHHRHPFSPPDSSDDDGPIQAAHGGGHHWVKSFEHFFSGGDVRKKPPPPAVEQRDEGEGGGEDDGRRKPERPHRKKKGDDDEDGYQGDGGEPAAYSDASPSSSDNDARKDSVESGDDRFNPTPESYDRRPPRPSGNAPPPQDDSQPDDTDRTDAMTDSDDVPPTPPPTRGPPLSQPPGPSGYNNSGISRPATAPPTPYCSSLSPAQFAPPPPAFQPQLSFRPPPPFPAPPGPSQARASPRMATAPAPPRQPLSTEDEQLANSRFIASHPPPPRTAPPQQRYQQPGGLSPPPTQPYVPYSPAPPNAFSRSPPPQTAAYARPPSQRFEPRPASRAGDERAPQTRPSQDSGGDSGRSGSESDEEEGDAFQPQAENNGARSPPAPPPPRARNSQPPQQYYSPYPAPPHSDRQPYASPYTPPPSLNRPLPGAFIPRPSSAAPTFPSRPSPPQQQQTQQYPAPQQPFYPQRSSLPGAFSRPSLPPPSQAQGPDAFTPQAAGNGAPPAGYPSPAPLDFAGSGKAYPSTSLSPPQQAAYSPSDAYSPAPSPPQPYTSPFPQPYTSPPPPPSSYALNTAPYVSQAPPGPAFQPQPQSAIGSYGSGLGNSSDANGEQSDGAFEPQLSPGSPRPQTFNTPLPQVDPYASSVQPGDGGEDGGDAFDPQPASSQRDEDAGGQFADDPLPPATSPRGAGTYEDDGAAYGPHRSERRGRERQSRHDYSSAPTPTFTSSAGGADDGGMPPSPTATDSDDYASSAPAQPAPSRDSGRGYASQAPQRDGPEPVMDDGDDRTGGGADGGFGRGQLDAGSGYGGRRAAAREVQQDSGAPGGGSDDAGDIQGESDDGQALPSPDSYEGDADDLSAPAPSDAGYTSRAGPQDSYSGQQQGAPAPPSSDEDYEAATDPPAPFRRSARSNRGGGGRGQDSRQDYPDNPQDPPSPPRNPDDSRSYRPSRRTANATYEDADNSGAAPPSSDDDYGQQQALPARSSAGLAGYSEGYGGGRGGDYAQTYDADAQQGDLPSASSSRSARRPRPDNYGAEGEGFGGNSLLPSQSDADYAPSSFRSGGGDEARSSASRGTYGEGDEDYDAQDPTTLPPDGFSSRPSRSSRRPRPPPPSPSPPSSEDGYSAPDQSGAFSPAPTAAREPAASRDGPYGMWTDASSRSSRDDEQYQESAHAGPARRESGIGATDGYAGTDGFGDSTAQDEMPSSAAVRPQIRGSSDPDAVDPYQSKQSRSGLNAEADDRFEPQGQAGNGIDDADSVDRSRAYGSLRTQGSRGEYGDAAGSGGSGWDGNDDDGQAFAAERRSSRRGFDSTDNLDDPSTAYPQDSPPSPPFESPQSSFGPSTTRGRSRNPSLSDEEDDARSAAPPAAAERRSSRDNDFDEGGGGPDAPSDDGDEPSRAKDRQVMSDSAAGTAAGNPSGNDETDVDNGQQVDPYTSRKSSTFDSDAPATPDAQPSSLSDELSGSVRPSKAGRGQDQDDPQQDDRFNPVGETSQAQKDGAGRNDALAAGAVGGVAAGGAAAYGASQLDDPDSRDDKSDQVSSSPDQGRDFDAGKDTVDSYKPREDLDNQDADGGSYGQDASPDAAEPDDRFQPDGESKYQDSPASSASNDPYSGKQDLDQGADNFKDSGNTQEDPSFADQRGSQQNGYGGAAGFGGDNQDQDFPSQGQPGGQSGGSNQDGFGGGRQDQFAGGQDQVAGGRDPFGGGHDQGASGQDQFGSQNNLGQQGAPLILLPPVKLIPPLQILTVKIKIPDSGAAPKASTIEQAHPGFGQNGNFNGDQGYQSYDNDPPPFGQGQDPYGGYGQQSDSYGQQPDPWGRGGQDGFDDPQRGFNDAYPQYSPNDSEQRYEDPYYDQPQPSPDVYAAAMYNGGERDWDREEERRRRLEEEEWDRRRRDEQELWHRRRDSMSDSPEIDKAADKLGVSEAEYHKILTEMEHDRRRNLELARQSGNPEAIRRAGEAHADVVDHIREHGEDLRDRHQDIADDPYAPDKDKRAAASARHVAAVHGVHHARLQLAHARRHLRELKLRRRPPASVAEIYQAEDAVQRAMRELRDAEEEERQAREGPHSPEHHIEMAQAGVEHAQNELEHLQETGAPESEVRDAEKRLAKAHGRLEEIMDRHKILTTGLKKRRRREICPFRKLSLSIKTITSRLSQASSRPAAGWRRTRSRRKLARGWKWQKRRCERWMADAIVITLNSLIATAAFATTRLLPLLTSSKRIANTTSRPSTASTQRGTRSKLPRTTCTPRKQLIRQTHSE
ncbi:hypothetical protein JCM10213v2_002312 [Rhodosporidiobolus nylandii]